NPEVVHKIRVQRQGLILRVVQVLFAYIFRQQGDAHATMRMERQLTGCDPIGRKNDRSVGFPRRAVPFFPYIVDVPVPAPCRIDIPVYPPRKPYAGRGLDTGAIALADIGPDGIADIVKRAGEHQLIAVSHQVIVDSKIVRRRGLPVAGFEIAHTFGSRLDFVLQVIAARRLTVCDGIRSIDHTSVIKRVAEAGLRIEKVVFVRNGVCTLVVVSSCCGVCDTPPLNVRETTKAVVKPVLNFSIEVSIRLVGFTHVELLPGCLTKGKRSPNNFSEVVRRSKAMIAAGESKIVITGCMDQREGRTVEVVLKPFACDEIAGLDEAVADDQVWKSQRGKRFTLVVVLIVPASIGVV